MTPQQAIEALNNICSACGKYASSQRFQCADCKIESWRQETVLELQTVTVKAS